MDGLDNRGQVVVIGATNRYLFALSCHCAFLILRIDHIDPGLRRPGRFDREFLFTLPTAPAVSLIALRNVSWVAHVVEEVDFGHSHRVLESWLA